MEAYAAFNRYLKVLLDEVQMDVGAQGRARCLGCFLGLLWYFLGAVGIAQKIITAGVVVIALQRILVGIAALGAGGRHHHVALAEKEDATIVRVERGDGAEIIGRAGDKGVFRELQGSVTVYLHLGRVAESHFLQLIIGELIDSLGIGGDFHPMAAVET